jgi:hypothetical protein
MAQTEGRSDLERGFAVVTAGRSLSHIYPFDRAAAIKAKGASVPPPISLWRKTEKFFANFSKHEWPKFEKLMFEEHRNQGAACASRDYTLAEVCLQVPKGLRRIQNMNLRERVEELDRLGLLPTPLGVHMEDDDGSSSSSSSTAKRTRFSVGGGGIFEENDDDDSDKSFPLRCRVIEAAALFQAESDEGCLFTTTAEEWVLGEALVNEALQEAYQQDPPKVFDRKLKKAFLTVLKETGMSVPVVYLADADADDAPRGVVPQPQRLFRELDLQRVFARYDARTLPSR